MATSLLNIDRQHSVLGALSLGPRAYSPYGFLSGSLGSGLAFCGQYQDPLTHNYLLGSGHRSYSPGLMRFITPDSLSPFSKGGINGYAYCEGDPINRHDSTGRVWQWIPPLAQAASSVSTGLGAVNRRSLAVVRQRIQRMNGELPDQELVRAELADSLQFYSSIPMGAVANLARNILNAPVSPADPLVSQLVWTGAGGSSGVAIGTNLNGYSVYQTWTQLADQHGINRWSVVAEAIGQVLLPPFVRRGSLQAGQWAAEALGSGIAGAYRVPGRVMAKVHSDDGGEVLRAVLVVRGS
ncbi:MULTISPECIES: RHS repeat-associated core domain-containing protein [Pseudomonas]|uniref:RHS repeat-associated core domain-containing protein n=1 Tax=Pseudomonas TaxID=286 RepID=UPI0009B6F471|nr:MULTISPECIES: RHS repeat-associated core domain-containing protein [Pseudomonas]WOB59192.1 RHS repeat-associated core domain-containing protein [Pseudomonas sp. NBB]